MKVFKDHDSPICREWVDDGSFRGYPCNRRAKYRVTAPEKNIALRGTRLVCGIHVKRYQRMGLAVEEVAK